MPKLNPSKCKTLYIGRQNSKHTYYLNNTPLEEVSVVRDLGIQVSIDLSFSNHVYNIYNRAISRVHLLFKAVHSSDMDLLRRLYLMYVRSILDFSSPVYNGLSKGDIKLLERVQQRATKLIFQRNYSLTCSKDPIPEYEQRLHLLKLDSLEVHRLKTDLIFYHKLLKWENRVNTEGAYFGNIAPITRTNRHGIKPTTARTQIRKRSFFIRIPPIYLKLPPYIQEAKTGSNFANLLDNYDVKGLLLLLFR